jgi:hypothetical protein
MAHNYVTCVIRERRGRRCSADAKLPINGSLSNKLDVGFSLGAITSYKGNLASFVFCLEYDGQELGFVLYQPWLIIQHLQQLQELTIDKKLPTRVCPLEG